MFRAKLEILREHNLIRELRDRESRQGPVILFHNKPYVNFASNDYLGLSSHPYLIKRIKQSLDSFGFGAGASRLLGGGTLLHRELEIKVASFKETESALVFNSGYAANTSLIPALAGEDTAIFSDELNHASIVDGCRLSKAGIFVFRHRDISHLDELIKKNAAQKNIIITDTVFSMNGDLAPLRDLYDLCRRYTCDLPSHNSLLLYLDEAHSTGVLGTGKGALNHFGLKPEPWVIQMGTFSKAFGSFGAFAAGTKDIIQWAENTARSFIYSTALPSCVVAASLASFDIIANDTSLLKKLWSNREKIVKGIQDCGYDTGQSETPIIPIMTGTVENTLRISERLFENGIYAPAIRPPTVREPRIRVTVTAAHTDKHIERLIEALKKA
ncbi:MAG: 8-amino-7-oxononanoate synthase [Thermodesulfovibrionales bacterium]|nr:8-amino-7-oxononanoate synthase [Thermodesulfovibrionales bacterium]